MRFRRIDENSIRSVNRVGKVLNRVMSRLYKKPVRLYVTEIRTYPFRRLLNFYDGRSISNAMLTRRHIKYLRTTYNNS